MDESKRHLYRIDPLKVQQKIFDLYEPGSDARNMMIKEQKMQEYNKLSKTLTSFPVTIAQETVKNSKRIIGFALLRVLGGFGFAYGVSSFLPIATTTVQLVTVFSLITLGLGYSFANLLQIGVAVYSMNLFNQSVKGLEERISKLKRDIFQ